MERVQSGVAELSRQPSPPSWWGRQKCLDARARTSSRALDAAQISITFVRPAAPDPPASVFQSPRARLRTLCAGEPQATPRATFRSRSSGRDFSRSRATGTANAAFLRRRAISRRRRLQFVGRRSAAIRPIGPGLGCGSTVRASSGRRSLDSLGARRRFFGRCHRAADVRQSANSSPPRQAIAAQLRSPTPAKSARDPNEARAAAAFARAHQTRRKSSRTLRGSSHRP